MQTLLKNVTTEQSVFAQNTEISLVNASAKSTAHPVGHLRPPVVKLNKIIPSLIAQNDG